MPIRALLELLCLIAAAWKIQVFICSQSSFSSARAQALYRRQTGRISCGDYNEFQILPPSKVETDFRKNQISEHFRCFQMLQLLFQPQPHLVVSRASVPVWSPLSVQECVCHAGNLPHFWVFVLLCTQRLQFQLGQAPLCISFCPLPPQIASSGNQRGSEAMNFLILFASSSFLALSVTFALAKVFLWGMQSCWHMCMYYTCTKPPKMNFFPWDPVIGWWEWFRTLLKVYNGQQEAIFYRGTLNWDLYWEILTQIRLPRKEMDTPGLLVFKKGLENALNRL